ncbi:MAG TPA: hypothetical protein VEK15_14900, partial [Vicinamibacteria bacterium]|nr:hypothetical protein [Vicinamibacteria bacterium]
MKISTDRRSLRGDERSVRSARRRLSPSSSAIWLLLASCAFARAAPSAAEDGRKRVLVLYSFGREYFNEFRYEFRDELARRSNEPVELFDIPMETARFAGTAMEGPFRDYLSALFADHRVDLLVTMGAPAARFCLNHREQLFPSSPLLLAGVERRVLADISVPEGVVAVPVVIDFQGAVENILRIAPETTEIVIVLGGSAISRLWLAETRKAFQPLADRARFTWLQGLSLEEMQERVAGLSPQSAILFGEYGDAAGIVN